VAGRRDAAAPDPDQGLLQYSTFLVKTGVVVPHDP
jgi:hypothetical protein